MQWNKTFILNCGMHKIYDDTALTPMRVARMSGYIDWQSQPSTFKHYPDFLFRYKYKDNPDFKIVELSRVVTLSSIIASKPYLKLNTPSAGNLHPLELYIQIRGVKGVLSGIYHVDASLNEIVLLQEIEDDGIEQLVGLNKRINGYIFVVSIVAFRSKWKYQDRALRYCYLDAGHQIDSIYQAATILGQSVEVLSDYDSNKLDEIMGFKDEEFSCAVLSIGSISGKDVKILNKKIMQVAPTDYCESNSNLKNIFENKLSAHKMILQKNIHLDENIVLNRRSARKFAKNYVDTSKLVDSLSSMSLNFSNFIILLKSSDKKLGIYLDDILIKIGDFKEEISSLLVDQQFIKNATMVVVITSDNFDKNELINSAILVNRLYLLAQKSSIAFTGIGAFYDYKLQKFLSTKNYIHYVCAAGAIE